MIIYDSKDKELNIPIGLGNLNRVSPDYSGGNCNGLYEEGYDDGFEKGKTEGIEEGYADGFDSGKTEGITEGYANGYDVGKIDGFQEGKNEGIEDYVDTLPTLNITENGVYETVNKGVTVNVSTTTPTDLLRIAGTGIKFGHSKFTEIPQNIDFAGVTDFSYMFYNTALTSVRNINTSSATNMSNMFATPIVYIPAKPKISAVSLFDTSKVTNMTGMFIGCGDLTTVPLFETSRVRKMENMFNTCSSLTTVPLFDTSSVTTMKGMFYNCSSLTSVPLFNTSKVTTMEDMFNGCSSLTTIPAFDTSSVTTMNGIFLYSYNLETLPAFDCSLLENAWFFGNNSYTTLYEKLTNIGGFIGLKTSTFLTLLPNLTYQSCINVLNGLYNFVENNEVPDSSQGQLKVHPNFLTTVGEDINIGINKGWVITA